MKTLAVLLLSFAAFGSQAHAAAEGDWPCVQRKVAELSPGQMWAGPELGDAPTRWRDDPTVAELSAKLASRRTPMEEAAIDIERFAIAAGPQKNVKLTLLFAAVFERINGGRSRLVDGIERYAQKQRALAERIKEAQVRRVQAGTAIPAELEQSLRWDTRIYDERAQALTYVCESPVILEQRAFALAREIQNHLD